MTGSSTRTTSSSGTRRARCTRPRSGAGPTAMARSSTSWPTSLWATRPPSRRRVRPAAVPATGRSAPRGRLPQRIRRLLRQPMRRHRVPGHVRSSSAPSTATRGPDRGSVLIGGGATPAARTGRSPRIATSGPWETRTSSPVLVVGNYFDGVTDYAGARAVNRQLANSRLLSYAGWGHTAYGRSECTTAHVDAYLHPRHAATGGNGLPGEPESVPRAVAGRCRANRASRGHSAELAAPARAVGDSRKRDESSTRDPRSRVASRREVTDVRAISGRPLLQLAVEESSRPLRPSDARLAAPKARSVWTWLAFPGEVARPPAEEPC